MLADGSFHALDAICHPSGPTWPCPPPRSVNQSGEGSAAGHQMAATAGVRKRCVQFELLGGEMVTRSDTLQLPEKTECVNGPRAYLARDALRAGTIIPRPIATFKFRNRVLGFIFGHLPFQC